MFGINEQVSVLSAIAVIPIFFWELSLGVYTVVKGFRPSPIPSTTVASPSARIAAGRPETQSSEETEQLSTSNARRGG